MKLRQDYVLGDTIARYMQPGPGGPVGMMLFPAAMAQIAEKSSAIDSLVQIKTVGDTYPGGSAGRSFRNGGTVATLTVESQREDTTDAGVTVVTLLRTHQGCLVLVVAHRLGTAERTPIEVPMPPGRYEVSDLYSHRREIVIKLAEELVAVELDEPFSAAALVITQIE